MAQVTKLHKALLIMHSPTDDTVGIDNATRIFVAAKHPKSFVSLAGADHLLSGKRDAAYVADVIAAWAERYIDPAVARAARRRPDEAPRKVVVRETRAGKFQQTISVGPHRLTADEPVAAGGDDTGPGPYDLRAGRPRRLHLDDHADVCRPQVAAAGTRHGDARTTARFTRKIAPSAKPGSACSTSSTG